MDKFDFLNTTLEALPPVVFVHFHLLNEILAKGNNTDRVKELSKSPNLVVSAGAVAALARIVAQRIYESSVNTCDTETLDLLKAVNYIYFPWYFNHFHLFKHYSH